MDTLFSPIRYEGLSEKDVQAHIRHSAANLQPGDRVEFLLCEASVVVPMVKHIYRSKPSTLDVLIRSGSIGRDPLNKLNESLSKEGYELKASRTSKRKLLSRVVVRLPIDGTVAVNGLKILKAINTALGVDWPTSVAVGYAIGSQRPDLPGRLSFRQPLGNVVYEVGHAVGTLLKKILS
jgi:hypothetical protein